MASTIVLLLILDLTIVDNYRRRIADKIGLWLKRKSRESAAEQKKIQELICNELKKQGICDDLAKLIVSFITEDSTPCAKDVSRCVLICRFSCYLFLFCPMVLELDDLVICTETCQRDNAIDDLVIIGMSVR